MEHERPFDPGHQAITEGIDRLVFFSDAVVAIAATLLILPLVELAPEVHAGGLGHFLHEHSDKLVAFFISFFVIAQFWEHHHSAFRGVETFDNQVAGINFLWLLGIVFLPFPTQIVAANGIHDGPTNALYVGTMVLVGFANAGLLARLDRHLTRERDAIAVTRVASALIAAFTLLLSALVAGLVPSVGLWVLFLLIPSGIFSRWIAIAAWLRLHPDAAEAISAARRARRDRRRR